MILLEGFEKDTSRHKNQISVIMHSESPRMTHWDPFNFCQQFFFLIKKQF